MTLSSVAKMEVQKKCEIYVETVKSEDV